MTEPKDDKHSVISLQKIHSCSSFIDIYKNINIDSYCSNLWELKGGIQQMKNQEILKIFLMIVPKLFNRKEEVIINRRKIGRRMSYGHFIRREEPTQGQTYVEQSSTYFVYCHNHVMQKFRNSGQPIMLLSIKKTVVKEFSCS